MHPSSSPTILPSAHPPSRNNINPHSHTFSIAPASAANASAFLQVSLSKILGDQLSPFTSTWLASDFRSTLTTSRQRNTPDLDNFSIPTSWRVDPRRAQERTRSGWRLSRGLIGPASALQTSSRRRESGEARAGGHWSGPLEPALGIAGRRV